ncbi:MAG TPA: hypothetical protein VMZ00_12205 [Sporichthya sp.]|nr:hypothetical protein [Sporichthya sp.]
MNARAARVGASVLHSPRPVPPRTARAGTAKAPLAAVPDVPVRTGRVPFVMLIVLVLSGGLAALLGFNTALAQGSFTASKLQKQATELDDRSQSLEEQLARAAAPDRLAKDARKIGMVPAPGVAFLSLADGTVTDGALPAPYIPPPLTPAQRAELEAKQRAEAQKAAEARAAKAVRKALKQEQAAAERQQLAAQRAAAAEQAKRDAAQREWQQKLAEQEKSGSRGGGEQVVDPPPGN